MIKNILFLTYSYAPESNAAANRIFERIPYFLNHGYNITVISPYAHITKYDNLHEIRAYAPFKRSENLILRVISTIIFMFHSFFLLFIHSKKESFIFASSPPFSVFISAYFAALAKRSKLVLEVADLWPDTLVNLNYLSKKNVLYSLWKKVEIYLYKKAKIIIALSEGIKKNILYESSSKLKPDKIIVARNGYNSNYWSNFKIESDKFRIGYYGKLGRAQSIITLIHASIILKEYKDINFKILGSGSEFNKLQKIINDYNLKNITLKSYATKEEVRKAWESTDLCVIPLKNSDVFDTAIPSKITEAIGTETPILLSSKICEASNIISSEGFGIISEPENANILAEKILELYKNTKEYNKLKENLRNKRKFYDRKKQTEIIINKIEKYNQ